MSFQKILNDQFNCENAHGMMNGAASGKSEMEVVVADKHSGIMMRQPLLASVLKQVRHRL